MKIKVPLATHYFQSLQISKEIGTSMCFSKRKTDPAKHVRHHKLHQTLKTAEIQTAKVEGNHIKKNKSSMISLGEIY